MMAGSHVLLGLASWFAAAPIFGLPSLSVVSVPVAVLGSLMPDIDHPKSWVGKRTRPVSSFIARHCGHRGFTHSAIIVALCLFLLHNQLGLPKNITVPFLVGYLSHLAGDFLTPKGLRLAWPIKKNWGIPLCKAGSPLEPLVVAMIMTWSLAGTPGPIAMRDLWRESYICNSTFSPETCGSRNSGRSGAVRGADVPDITSAFSWFRRIL
jgi:inner membrane protein